MPLEGLQHKCKCNGYQWLPMFFFTIEPIPAENWSVGKITNGPNDVIFKITRADSGSEENYNYSFNFYGRTQQIQFNKLQEIFVIVLHLNKFHICMHVYWVSQLYVKIMWMGTRG